MKPDIISQLYYSHKAAIESQWRAPNFYFPVRWAVSYRLVMAAFKAVVLGPCVFSSQDLIKRSQHAILKAEVRSQRADGHASAIFCSGLVHSLSCLHSTSQSKHHHTDHGTGGCHQSHKTAPRIIREGSC